MKINLALGGVLLLLLTAVAFSLTSPTPSTAQDNGDQIVYLPNVRKDHTPTPTPSPTPLPTPTPTPSPTPSPPTDNVEFRGLWVTRFDWSSAVSGANPAKIDEIVNNAANAGFNAIFFQVRGTADAFYTPGLEPWSQRMTGGVLGQAPNPLWDPLQRMIDQAHARGIQVHAYMNIYPVWTCGSEPPQTNPQHLWHRLEAQGTTSGKINNLTWNQDGSVNCASYFRVSPASIYFDNHVLAVGADLINRYDIDGIHLDYIRYGGRATSCDPISTSRYGASCNFDSGQYQSWQRQQVNGTVAKFYDLVTEAQKDIWLSAAVWPVYIDYWGWGASEGYHDYYQDSKAWIGGGYIDSISPMIYGTSFFTQARWEALVANFQAGANGRFVIPGIGADYDDFAEIENRINAARALGVPGHAIFSYGALNANGYWDDLANGPYAEPAVPPEVTWHE